MDYSPQGIHFQPFLPDGVGPIALSNIPYRNTKLQISISGQGQTITSCRTNGCESQPFLPADSHGDIHMEFTLG